MPNAYHFISSVSLCLKMFWKGKNCWPEKKSLVLKIIWVWKNNGPTKFKSKKYLVRKYSGWGQLSIVCYWKFIWLFLSPSIMWECGVSILVGCPGWGRGWVVFMYLLFYMFQSILNIVFWAFICEEKWMIFMDGRYPSTSASFFISASCEPW